MAGRVPERFVPLAVDAYIELSDVHPMAELLYYRMLQWAKAHPKTEGVVPDIEARGALARGMKPGVQLKELKNAGRIVDEPGGWFIRVWFDFNPTKTEVAERRQTRTVGAHIANHKQGRHKTKVGACPLCYRSSERSSDATSDAPASRSSDAEQESVSSLARAKGTPTGRPKGGALRGAPLWHTYTPQHHPTQDQLRDATPAERLTIGWPFDPDKPWLGGHEDNGRIWRTWQMPPWSPHNPDRPQANASSTESET